MRLTFAALGWELDLTLGPADPPSPGPDDEDKARDLSGGTTGSTPMGFTPQWGDQRWQPGGEP